MGLTRSEQWTLIAVVALIGIGFSVQYYRDRQLRSPLWVEPGAGWTNLEPNREPSLLSPGTPRLPSPSELGGGRQLPGTSSEQLESDTAGGRIDLNRASPQELELLPGIGPSKASAIISYRIEFGDFTSPDQVMQVKGIGPKTFEALRPLIRVSAGTKEGLETSSTTLGLHTRPSDKVDSYALKAPLINVNFASRQELEKLTGIGPVLAGRIIEGRERAPFRSVEELMRIPGIGPKRLEGLRDQVSIARPSHPTPETESTPGY